VPNDPLYYLYDGHNSVTQMINSAGHVRDKYRYDPFGTPMPGGKLSPNTRLFNNPYGYNGEAHDIDSGLQFLRARYYDPSMGRFQTRDSYLGEIMNPLSLNRYVYTANNPVMYSDPSGHIPNPDTFQAYSYKPTLAEQFLQYSPMNSRPEPTVIKPMTITEVMRSFQNPHVVPENSSVGPTISNSVSNSVRVTDSKSYADQASAKKPNYNTVQCSGKDISSQGTSEADLKKLNELANSMQKDMQAHPIGTLQPPFCDIVERIVNSNPKDLNFAEKVIYGLVVPPTYVDENGNTQQYALGIMPFGVGGIGKGAIKGAGNAWKGSGPAPGVLGVNPASESVGALKNYYPRNGSIEYVFDPKTKTFVSGAPKSGMFTGSPHQQLAQTIGADESSVVGGMFSRGANGEIITNEASGHYWQNWTPGVREQFQSVMQNYGLPVIHYGGK
ncbi:RHS repeat-associated core domain-containing protein, partial [Desulfosporosinus nitroreducens]|uniref:RHS repeat-associated core domain-containing protein n=1 Tax=Desulfosporosinus nitroreducens TaxID=2018668 RepID=UPI00207C5710